MKTRGSQAQLTNTLVFMDSSLYLLALTPMRITTLHDQIAKRLIRYVTVDAPTNQSAAVPRVHRPLTMLSEARELRYGAAAAPCY